MAVDVTRLSYLQNLVDTTLAAYGRIDVLVNNAGIFDYYTNSLDTSEDLWDKIFAINVKSMFQLSNLVLPHMQAQKQGAIINICSIAGLVSEHGSLFLTASKHAVQTYTKHLAAVYGKTASKSMPLPRHHPHRDDGGNAQTRRLTNSFKTLCEVGEVVDLACS